MFKKHKIKIAKYLNELTKDYKAFSSYHDKGYVSSTPFYNKLVDYVKLCCMEDKKRTENCISLLNDYLQDNQYGSSDASLIHHSEIMLQANGLALIKINLLLACLTEKENLSVDDLENLKKTIIEYTDIESKCLYYNSNYLPRHIKMINDVFDDNATSMRKFFIFEKGINTDLPRSEDQKKLETYLSIFDMFDKLIEYDEEFIDRYKESKTLYDNDCIFTRKVITYNMLVAEKIHAIDEYVIENYGKIFEEKPSLDKLDLEKLLSTQKIFADIIKLNSFAIDKLELACEAELDGCNSSDFESYRMEMMEYINKEANIIEKHFNRGEDYLKSEKQLLNQLCSPNYPNLYNWRVIEHTK